MNNQTNMTLFPERPSFLDIDGPGLAQELDRLRMAGAVVIAMDSVDVAQWRLSVCWRKAKLGEESELMAHAVKIDAQTILGDLLRQMPKPKGREVQKTRNGPMKFRDKVQAAGISNHQSKDAQSLSKAKEQAPDLHAQVRKGTWPDTNRNLEGLAATGFWFCRDCERITELAESGRGCNCCSRCGSLRFEFCPTVFSDHKSLVTEEVAR